MTFTARQNTSSNLSSGGTFSTTTSSQIWRDESYYLETVQCPANNCPSIITRIQLCILTIHSLRHKWASCNAADMSRHVILIHTGQGSKYDAKGHVWEIASCFPWCAIVCINKLIHNFSKYFQEHLFKTVSKNTAQFGSGVSLETMWVLHIDTVVEDVLRFFT